ncbi:hypothetical protein MY4824_006369 [Beauveria thailandica]
MKLAILLLAAALGSASPVRTQNSIQGRDGQNACDCSKPFNNSAGGADRCPAGYKDISETMLPECVQVNCSADDYKAQCSCDCSKPFNNSDGGADSCPAGYKDISDTPVPECVQVNCSANGHKAQCSAKPQDTTPPAVVEKPTNKPTALSEQNACDCSKPFGIFVDENESCPAGYKDISDTHIPECVQVNCSADDHKAQCSAKPQDTTPTAVVEKPTNKPTALGEQNACDCSKPFRISVDETESCPAGYKDISGTHIPECVQVNCSADDHKAQCDAKKDAKPAASACA